MPSRIEAEVYRNLTRRAWSVRIGGKVVGHFPAIALRDVILRASEASRLRCLRTGSRDVHAWARGVPAPGLPRPAEAIRIRYRPLVEKGFRELQGGPVSLGHACWLEADGSAWILASAGETLGTGGPDMADAFTFHRSDLAHLGCAGVLDDWAFQSVGRRGAGYVLVGTDAQCRDRVTGRVEAYDLREGWAWAIGTGLFRLGTARSAIPSTGVTL